jgi:hypothetical protein
MAAIGNERKILVIRDSTVEGAGCIRWVNSIGPTIDFAERGCDSALDGAQFGERFRCPLRHFVELHDHVLDHGGLDARTTEEFEAIVTVLINQRLAARAVRRHPSHRPAERADRA